MRRWEIDFPRDPPMTLSVNLSVRQLLETDTVEAVKDPQAPEFRAENLHLEITESVIMHRPDLVTAILSRLRDLESG